MKYLPHLHSCHDFATKLGIRQENIGDMQNINEKVIFPLIWLGFLNWIYVIKMGFVLYYCDAVLSFI